MRETLDLGRPDHLQLIFDRRVTGATPSRYRTRAIPTGSSRRCTSTTSTRASSSTTMGGRLPAYRDGVSTTPTTSASADGCATSRIRRRSALPPTGTLLRAQRVSHNYLVGAEAFDDLHRPRAVDGQRAFGAALRGDLRPHRPCWRGAARLPHVPRRLPEPRTARLRHTGCSNSPSTTPRPRSHAPTTCAGSRLPGPSRRPSRDPTTSSTTTC